MPWGFQGLTAILWMNKITGALGDKALQRPFHMEESEQMGSKSAFIAIVGKPNAGKSTLLNALVGEKVAIVSAKPQTTRTKITGVLTTGDIQYVFIDTPGLHRARTKLGEHMVKAVKDSVADVDAAILVVESAGEPAKAELELMETFRATKIPAILVINKIDTLQDKSALIGRIQKYADLYEFSQVIPISALTGDGVSILLDELQSYAKDGPHYFPDDAMTDQPERVIAAEIIREKILNYLYEEIPHGTAVTIEEMKQRENSGILDIQATIFCEGKSHKGMIIGKGGEMLKKIATDARIDMESFFDCKVNLQCWVKYKDDWRNKEGIIKSLGLS